MRKTNTKSYVLIALFVLLLAIAVGYAAFSSTLKITGTATANGNWDVRFTAASVSPSTGNSAQISTSQGGTTNDTVTVSVALTQPGDSATVTTTITNQGSVDAKLNGLTIKAADGTTAQLTTSNASHTYGAITANLNASNVADNSTIAANGGTATYTLTFEWPASYTSENVDDTLRFEITLPYEQAN